MRDALADLDAGEYFVHDIEQMQSTYCTDDENQVEKITTKVVDKEQECVG